MTATFTGEIESLAYAAWPAETEHHDGDWVLRTVGGFSRRLNSVQASQQVAGFEPSLRRAASYYAQRGLPLIFRVTPLCDAIDPVLESRGFRREARTRVMVANVPVAAPGAQMTVFNEPTEAWVDAQRTWLTIPSPSPWLAILTRSAKARPRTGFGLLAEAEHSVAAGLGVVDGDWMGLFEITVDPQHRRRGLGRLATEELLGWGRRMGARRCYLQVQESNRAAQHLYRSLGFVTRYTYWYRSTPAAAAK